MDDNRPPTQVPDAPPPNNNATAVAPPEEYDDSLNPLGWEFNPSHEAITYILRKKIAGIEVNLDKTLEVEGGFYSKTPDEIFAGKPFSFKNKHLALVKKSFKNKAENSFNRKVTGGGVLGGQRQGNSCC